MDGHITYKTERYKYREYDDDLLLVFDFDIKSYTGHVHNTFYGHKSLLFFLTKHQTKRIIITLDQVDDFEERGDDLVVNLRKYQDFCRCLGSRGENRAQAFLRGDIRIIRLQIMTSLRAKWLY